MTVAQTADECAERLWDRYCREVRGGWVPRTVAAAERTMGEDAESVARAVVSAFQDKSGGNAFERILAEEVGGFLRSRVDLQVRTKRDDRVPFDVCLIMPRLYVALSCTTIPQERKNEVWPNEARHLHDRRKELADGRATDFYGVFACARDGCTVEQSRNVARRKADLWPEGRVIAVHDTERTAETLRGLLSRGV